MTTKTKIILAKCIVFPVYFITMPISFVVGGVRGVVKTWKMFEDLGTLTVTRKDTVDYFYEEIRPYIVIDRCKYKHVVADEKSNGHICYEKQDCFNCEYLHKK